MALKQIAFLTTNLSSALSTGTGINIPLASYTLLNSNLSASDTIYLVLERTHTTQREIILVSKTSNDNYNITSRGLFGTTEQSHESGVEVTCDDVPAYFEQLQDGTALASSAITTAKIADSAVTGTKLSTAAILLGAASATSNQGSITTEVNLTGLSVTVDVPSGGRSVLIMAKCNLETSAANDQLVVYIKESPGTYLQSSIQTLAVANRGRTFSTQVLVTPSSGSHTYLLSAERSPGTGTVTMTASSTVPAQIIVMLV